MSFRQPVKQHGINVEESRRNRESQVFGFQKQQREERSKSMRVMRVIKEQEDDCMMDATKIASLNPNSIDFVNLITLPQAQLLPILYRLGHQLSHSEITIQEAIDSLHLVPVLISLLLQENQSQKVQALVLWSLSTLASGTKEQAQTIIQHPAVLPMTVHLMRSECHNVRKRAVWLLANLALGCCEFRNTLLKHGVLQQATFLLFNWDSDDNAEQHDDLSFVVYWLVSSLFSYTSRLPKECLAVFSSVNAILIKMLDHAKGLYVDSALQILVNLTLPSLVDENEAEQVNCQVSFMHSFVELCGLTRLMKLLKSSSPNCVDDDSSPELQKMILTVIGRLIVCSDDDLNVNITEAVLQCRDCLPCLLLCATHSNVEIRQLVWWIVGNLAFGNPRHIQTILSCDALIQSMVQAATRQEYCIQKEIACVLYNIMSAGALDDILPLVLHRQALEIICNNQLQWHEPDFILQGLKILTRILLLTERKPMLHLKIKETIEKCRGLDVIESLQNSDNSAIYKQVGLVLTFWEWEENNDEYYVSQQSISNLSHLETHHDYEMCDDDAVSTGWIQSNSLVGY